jgi:multidrug resistance protein, MATE family
MQNIAHNLGLDEKSYLRSEFFRLAIINIISNLIIPLSGLISIAFLGHLTDIKHLAGVTLATILFNYLYRTIGFLRMTTTGVTAQALGRNDHTAILLTGLRNGIIALILGLIILICQDPLAKIGFFLISATPDVKLAAQSYYDGRILAAPATLINFVLMGWFLGQGKSGKVLILSIIGNGANIILDYLLIILWGWESKGAGLATTISQYLMLFIGLIFVIKQVKWREVRALEKQLLSLKDWKECLNLNRDIFIRTLAFLSTFSIFTDISSIMGTNILAQNALLLQVITLTVYLIDGLAYATESLAGIFKGQKAKMQFVPLLQISGITSLSIGVAIAVLFTLFPQKLLTILTNHTEVLDQVYNYTFWLIPVLIFGSLAFMLDGYFLGLTEGKILRNTAIIATVFVFIPLAAIAWKLNNCSILWLGLSLFMLARVTLLAIQVPKTLKT